MNTPHLIAVATLALFSVAMPASAQTADAITRADAATERLRSEACSNRGPCSRVNPMMPAPTGNVDVPQLSADQHLHQRVSGYTRDALDRGGWRNAWAAGDHYAAGEPLLAAAVGTGVTTRGAAPVEPGRQWASR